MDENLPQGNPPPAGAGAGVAGGAGGEGAGVGQGRESAYCIYSNLIQALGSVIGCLGAIPCVPCPNPYRVVEQDYVGDIYHFGQFHKSVGPGLIKVNFCTEQLRVTRMDTKIQTVPIDIQITQDKHEVKMYDYSHHGQITDARKAACMSPADLRQALIEHAKLAVRHAVRNKLSTLILDPNNDIGPAITERVNESVNDWGISVERILIKDLEVIPIPNKAE